MKLARSSVHYIASMGALAFLLASGTPSSAADLHPIVSTTAGRLQGQPSKGVYSFLGIPYGAPTGGKARFLPPEKPARWKGVRRADAFGNRCPQPTSIMGGEQATVISFSDLPISEDCLSLNVWTPAPGDHGKRPVMVWLHGGGFYIGTGAEKYYEGSNLSRGNDVVVVTLNHRLNIFGYLSLGPEAGPKFADSGLAGMQDIVMALQWVRDNIAAFGGDPSNVTIFGQSGGGSKVSTLMAMPGAQGLFHKAIIESGAAVRLATTADALAVRDQILAKLGHRPSEVEALQAIPMQDLVNEAAIVGLLAFRPAVDGKLLPTHPFDPTASPLSANVPVMVGNTKDEATIIFVADPHWQTMTDADLEKRVTGIVGAEQAPTVIALYRSEAPQDKPMHLWTSIVTDQMFTSSSVLLAERKAAQAAAPVYLYKVDWNSPVLNGKLRAPHTVEVPFVFDNVAVSAGLVGAGPEQERMARIMSHSFAAFARTGNPDTAELPHWPAYTLATRDTMLFDNTSTVVSDPGSRNRLYWAQVRPAAGPGRRDTAIQGAFKDAFKGKDSN